MTDDQQADVRALTKKAGISPTVTKVEPRHPLLGQLARGEAETTDDGWTNVPHSVPSARSAAERRATDDDRPPRGPRQRQRGVQANRGSQSSRGNGHAKAAPAAQPGRSNAVSPGGRTVSPLGRSLEQAVLLDHDDAPLRDRESPLAVELEVVADPSSRAAPRRSCR